MFKMASLKLQTVIAFQESSNNELQLLQYLALSSWEIIILQPWEWTVCNCHYITCCWYTGSLFT